VQRPSGDKARNPGLMDVARLAGVSHQTVSRVINEHPNVREETRVRVRAAIAQLGYRRNHAARALVTGKSQNLGVVAQASTMYGPTSMLASFQEAAAEAGFAVTVGSVRSLDRRSISEAIRRHLDQSVAGIVVIAPVVSAYQAIDDLPADIPLVTIGGDPHRPTPLVTVDQAAGAALATQCLLDGGHETVWHVSGPSGSFDSAGRIEGWEQTLRLAGRELPPLISADWTAAAGYKAGQLLARMPDVTAIFAANDHLALGLLRAMTERGRTVPQDVSVVGFDDVPEAAYFVPPLTTVRPDFDSVARATLEVLLHQLATGRRESQKNVIAPTLVPRSSVASPRGRP
jgi:DNA-binding LacI/PurR family transcriptional regulator